MGNSEEIYYCKLIGRVGRSGKRDQVISEEGIHLLFLAKVRFGLGTRKIGAAVSDSNGEFNLSFQLKNARRWSNKSVYLYFLEPADSGFKSVSNIEISKNGLVGMSYNLRTILLDQLAKRKNNKAPGVYQNNVKDTGWSNWRRGVNKLLLYLYSKLFAFIIAVGLSLPKQERMSHNNGIAGRGKLIIVDDPRFPEHEFFEPGKEFPIRIRHASATFLDDAMNCIRSVAIKFSDERFKSPFDLQMNTGAQSLFWSAASFLQFAWLRRETWGVEYVKYNRRYPEGLAGAQKAVRRYATSFHNLHYYAKTPFLFIGKDQVKRYAKYRIIPYEDIQESGLRNEPSDVEMSNQRVAENDARGRNYLKYEYEDRVNREGAKYRLQIQIRDAEEGESQEIFNNMIIWDEVDYPWMDLAIFEINQMLGWEESTLTAFSVNHMPKSLAALPASSIFDYNSINYMRKYSEMARIARNLSYKLYGMVPPIPDNDNRNVSGFGE